MKRLLLASAGLAALWSTALATEPSLLSPQNGAVFTVGEWVLFESEFGDGVRATGWSEDTYRATWRIEQYYGFYPGASGWDLVPELISFNIPGEYTVVRRCHCIDSTGGGCGGELFTNYFTITDDNCSRPFPMPEPVEPGQARPVVYTYLHRGPGERRQVLTLDNSFSKLPAIAIRNDGDKDLVLLDLFPSLEYDSFAITPVDFVPYTVVRPGHVHYVKMEGLVLDPDTMWRNGRTVSLFVLQTNDPGKPLRLQSIPFELFATESAIPDWYEFVVDPLPNGGTPACADLNGDGQIDASDVIETLIEE